MPALNTPEFFINNLRIAREMMLYKEPDEVDLDGWRQDEVFEDRTAKSPSCGSICCFGGWCAWEPAFRALGVRSDSRGAPRLPGDIHVSQHLFGVNYMFGIRQRNEGARPGDSHARPNSVFITDKQVVINRIDARLAALGAVA